MRKKRKEPILTILVRGVHGAGALTVTYLRHHSWIKTVMLATHSSEFRQQGRVSMWLLLTSCPKDQINVVRQLGLIPARTRAEYQE
jgi:hypothetical protein